MEISLVVPPNMIPKDSIRRIAAPLGMLYLAASLEKEGHDVDVFDCTCEGYYNTIVKGDFIIYGSSDEEIKDHIRQVKPDVVGINCLFLGREKQVFKIAKLVKEVDENIKIVLGGVHPTLFPRRMLSHPFVDFVILREGEFRIVALMRALEEGKNPDMEGICYKDKGKIVINPATTRIENLDEIPFPARHLVDFEKYVKICVPYAPFSKRERVAQLLTCYDDKTEVLTRDGWKFFKNLNKNDELITMNKNTKEIKYSKQKKIINGEYEGEMIHFKTKQVDLLVTPNHNVLVQINPKKEKFQFLKAEKLLNKNRFRFIKSGKWKGNDIKNIELNSFNYTSGRKNRVEKTIKKKIISIDIFLEFLGYFISEGYTQKKKTNNYKVVICQKEDTENYNKIKKCIKKLPFKYGKEKNKFIINSKQLFVFLNKEAGKGAKNKKIPDFVKGLSPKRISVLLDALILGDGSIATRGKNTQRVYITSSKKLIDDIQELLLKSGKFGNIKIHNKNTLGGFVKGRKIKNISKVYKIIFSNENKFDTSRPNIQKSFGQVKKINYKGNIYCCEVDNNTLYVRRNGKPVWSGNSRGCPFHCNFCSTQNYWGSFRARSVDNIMEEIEELATKYKIEEIQFLDDNMTVDKKRGKELFKRMKKYDLSWCTPHGLAIITLDEEMIRLMAESGAYQISVGVESGCQEVLDNIIHKRLNLNMVKPVVDAAHKHGISVHGLFVVGLPGETREQIMQTLNYPKKIGFESVSFFIATPLPGSDLWEECVKKGYLSDDYKNLNIETLEFKTTNIIIPKDSKDYTFSPEELGKLVDDKTKEYNEWSRKKWPNRWEAKFKTFLERHPKNSDLIMGRVT